MILVSVKIRNQHVGIITNALMVFFFNLPMRNYDVPEINCL